MPLRTLKTGIALRDRHLRENYLHTDRHPEALLLVPRAALRAPPPNGQVRIEVQGKLQLHGKSARCGCVTSSSTRVRSSESRARSSSIYATSRIPEPRYLGLKVSREIEVQATFAAADR